MRTQEKNKLLRLITDHVAAQIALSDKGLSMPEFWPAIEEDARTAADAVLKFIDTLEEGKAEMHVLRLQREVHMLNRSLCRKNRKLKAQYHELHDGRKNVRVESSEQYFGMTGVYRIVEHRRGAGGDVIVIGPPRFESEVAFRDVDPAMPHDPFKVYARRPGTANTSANGEPHCAHHERFEGNDCLECQDALEAQRRAQRERDNASGFVFKTPDDEVAVYVERRGALGVVLLHGETWTVVRLEHQPEGTHARIYAAGHESKDIIIPREAFR